MINFVKNFWTQISLSNISIPELTPNAIIDILLVAYIVYNVLLWIKETRAWSLLKGIFIVALITVFSNFFHLYTVYWIIQKTINAGIIAIIVLFTPEIRKALEQIGSNRRANLFFSSNKNKQIGSKSLDEIIHACQKMALLRTGAIIVIENNIAIGDIAQTGILIDADISMQLIMNIFEDKTPLHDGAVVIRNNRINTASCILPLTEREIGKELGTRHRAAVGVSEICDAYVIVVSEETGHISFATGGKLYKDVDENEIRDFINSSNKETKVKKTFLKGGSEK